ncbi:MAG: hypothetical protein J6V46_01515 [Methanobrevibacter sp.]|nr:hypothetical protein [Methanobrevibacter sp.]
MLRSSDKASPSKSEIPLVFMRSEDSLPVWGVTFEGFKSSASLGSC